MDTTAGSGPTPDAGNAPEPKDGPGFGEKLMEGAGDVGSKILSGAKKAAAAGGEAISDAMERYAPAAQEVASGIARETKKAFSKGIKPGTVALIGAGLCVLWMILPLVLGFPLHLQVVQQNVVKQSTETNDIPQITPEAPPAANNLPNVAGQVGQGQFTPQQGNDNQPRRAGETQAPTTAPPTATPPAQPPALPPATGGEAPIKLKGADNEFQANYDGYMYEADFRPAKLTDDTKALAIGALVLGGPIFGTGAALTAGTKPSVESGSEVSSTIGANLRAKNGFLVGAFFMIILAALFVICELVLKDYYGMEKVFAGVALVWLVYCYTFGFIAQMMMVSFAKKAGGISADLAGNPGALADAPMRILLAGIVILVFTWLLRKAFKIKQPA